MYMYIDILLLFTLKKDRDSHRRDTPFLNHGSAVKENHKRFIKSSKTRLR